MARSTTLAAAPIEVRSALDRKAKITVAAEPPPAPMVDFETESDDASDDAPEWPDAAVEDAMRAEFSDQDGLGGGGEKPARRPRGGQEDTLAGGPLPALDDLIAGIPDPVKKTMDELFRAQFSEVRRVPLAVLKKEVQASVSKT